MKFDTKGLSDTQLNALYEAMLLPRLIEERMLNLLRQGKISKWFGGIGQEAISAGVAKALKPTDYILPLHRNLGVFTGRGLPMERLFGQWMGRSNGYTKGRDRSFHFGAVDERIIGMISHLGAMLGVADGLALASTLDGSTDIALAFSGDGGASEGDFHEAINVAAVWDLPVIFLVENNGYGLSTPTADQSRCKQFVHKAKGYGIEGVRIDGNNIVDVFQTIGRIAAQMRKIPAPVLVEALTFRMRGHEEASGTAYVPEALFKKWGKRDPLLCFEKFLLERGLLQKTVIEERRRVLCAEIIAAWERACESPKPKPIITEELADVYKPSAQSLCAPKGALVDAPTKRFVDAISEGLSEAMVHDPKVVLMGQDVAEYGGVFKVSEGFLERFGKARVRNTPICESAIVGTAMGLAFGGHPAVMEMQFADFASCGFNQIVNNLAKTHYRWGSGVNVTVRMPTGGGIGAGPYHSQSCEAWFAHVPGLKIVFPSGAFDAKGLLTASIADPNPVLFFEHKFLYRRNEEKVPEGYYTLPIGKANVVHEGHRASIITYGTGVTWAKELLTTHDEFADIEVVDLRTLLPWDSETVFASVRKTNRCLVLHEATRFAGFGAEIASSIGEECFEYLDAPVVRVASLDTPVPFDKGLEEQFLPRLRLEQSLTQLLAY